MFGVPAGMSPSAADQAMEDGGNDGEDEASFYLGDKLIVEDEPQYVSQPSRSCGFG